MNQVFLIGHLGNGPELYSTQSGSNYAKFSLASHEAWGQGEDRRERTDWHQVIAWNGLAESARHLGKGDRVAIRGKLRTSRYEKDGQPRTRVEIEAQEIEFLTVKSFQDRGSLQDRDEPAAEPAAPKAKAKAKIRATKAKAA